MSSRRIKFDDGIIVIANHKEKSRVIRINFQMAIVTNFTLTTFRDIHVIGFA